MLEKLEAIKQRWLTIGQHITDPEVIADMKRYIRLSKEYKELQVIVDAYKIYKDVIENIASAKEILTTEKDNEFRVMAKVELDELTQKKAQLEEKIKNLLIPKDPEDAKNAVVEIRSGTGGDESSIFA